jgi:K+-transporting ATPase ATPase A chain
VKAVPAYLIQHFIFMFLHFTSAATGIACAVALFKAFRDKTTTNLGNFWQYFVKAITRLIVAIIYSNSFDINL